MLEVNANAYSFEAANARHEHEWRIWEDVTLPTDKLILPGIVSHATNVVEHPQLVADRLLRFAFSVVGRERVIASTDCGLGGRVDPTIAWAKLEALAQGAGLASASLWATPRSALVPPWRRDDPRRISRPSCSPSVEPGPEEGTVRTMSGLVIDCHGHFTTEPVEFHAFRQSQLDYVAGREADSSPNTRGIPDDELHRIITDNQLRVQIERGTDVTVLSPRASRMGHHVTDLACRGGLGSAL